MTRPSATARPEGRRASAGPLRLSLQLADAADRALLAPARVRRWLRAALQQPAEITLRVVGAREGRALNRTWRAQDHATNVLTFDYAREPVVVADLVLCGPVVRREARAARKPLEAHYAHLVVHGALHAQGWDHLEDAQAEAMEQRERAVLAKLGYPDPYG
jgi:probable rRNA maturation factor